MTHCTSYFECFILCPQFRERRYVLEVDSGSLSSVLNRNNCPSQQLQQMQAIEPAVASNEINGIRRGL
jgi:uncharacterized protein (DUF1499 family)